MVVTTSDKVIAGNASKDDLGKIDAVQTIRHIAGLKGALERTGVRAPSAGRVQTDVRRRAARSTEAFVEWRLCA